MSDTEGLAAFWAARLDEAEYHAKAAQLRAPGPWTHEAAPGPGLPGAEGMYDASGDTLAIVRGSYLADYLVRHDAARAIRSIEADRAILEAWQEQSGYDLEERVHDGRDPDERECDEALLGNLEMAARLRASVFSDHPDYRPAWKP